MNTRTVGLVGSAALLALGLVLTVASLRAEPVKEPIIKVAVAAQQIPPYSVVTQDVLKAHEMTMREARSRGAYPMEATVGLMATTLVTPGETLTGVNAKPVEEVRFVKDLGLEIVSFQVSVDRVVGGKVRPGHLINLYGTGLGEDREPFTVLVEPRIWVVGVSSAGQPVTNATPRPDVRTGELVYVGGDRDRPSTLITVAVPPEKAVNIIHQVGSVHLVPYVTLAASGTAQMPATPVAEAPPVGTPFSFPGLTPTQPPPFPTIGYGGAARIDP